MALVPIRKYTFVEDLHVHAQVVLVKRIDFKPQRKTIFMACFHVSNGRNFHPEMKWRKCY